jgi:hypothetical protein
MEVNKRLKMLIDKIQKMLLLYLFEFCIFIEKVVIGAIYPIDEGVDEMLGDGNFEEKL